MDKELKKRIKKLKRDRWATKTKTISGGCTGYREVGEWRNVNYNQGVYDVDKEATFSKKTITVPDQEKIDKAERELAEIYQSLGYNPIESSVLSRGSKLTLLLFRYERYAQLKDEFLEHAVTRALSLENIMNTATEVVQGPGYSADKWKDFLQPSPEKRQEARESLIEIYENNDWYSARFVAGKAIGKETPLDPWIDDLKKRIWKSISSEPNVKRFSNRVIDGRVVWGDEQEVYLGVTPDERTRIEAAYDSARFYNLLRLESPRPHQTSRLKQILKRAYHDNIAKVEMVAGTGLGYSRVRIFLHNWFKGSITPPEVQEAHGGAGWGYKENGEWKSGDNR